MAFWHFFWDSSSQCARVIINWIWVTLKKELGDPERVLILYSICILFLPFFQLSTCNNELIRMSQVCKLNHLKILNLSNNNIEFMDGLKELKLLSWLGLANNKIKTIQQLNQCVHLEHLDLSGNFIQHLNDLSFLKNLKVLVNSF